MTLSHVGLRRCEATTGPTEAFGVLEVGSNADPLLDLPAQIGAGDDDPAFRWPVVMWRVCSSCGQPVLGVNIDLCGALRTV